MTQYQDADERDVRATVQQVEENGYSPSRRDRILEWQSTQDFQVCPDPEDPDACNVYNELQFPDEVFKVFRITVRRRRKEPSAFGRELSRPGRER